MDDLPPRESMETPGRRRLWDFLKELRLSRKEMREHPKEGPPERLKPPRDRP